MSFSFLVSMVPVKENFFEKNFLSFVFCKFSHFHAQIKELSFWNKIKYVNLNIFRSRCCKPMIFQTQIIWSNRIHSLKYPRSATLGCKDTGIKNSEFVAKTQFRKRKDVKTMRNFATKQMRQFRKIKNFLYKRNAEQCDNFGKKILRNVFLHLAGNPSCILYKIQP